MQASNDYGEATVTCKLEVRGRQEPQEMSEGIQKLEKIMNGSLEINGEEEKPKPEPSFTVELKVSTISA